MIRNATEADLPAIVSIYNASIPGRLATADDQSVSIDSRRAWFHDRDWSRTPIWVMEVEGRVGGWLSFSKFYGRPAYAATAEISIYVDPALQRRRVATGLLQQAFVEAPALGLSTFLGFVFAHNHRSLALCQQFAFEQWGHLPRVALLDGVERDLVILGRRITGDGGGRGPFGL